MRRRDWLALATAALLPSVTRAAASPADQAARPAADLLELPALKSVRAAQSLMLGIAFAGQRLVAVGERGIVVVSDDFGTSWTQALVPVSVTLTAVCFADSRTGYAAGHDGVVLRTVDGGGSWTRVLEGNACNALIRRVAEHRVAQARQDFERAPAAGRPPLERALKDAQAAQEDAIAAAGAGPARPLLSLCFRDAKLGWVAGSYGMLFATHDGGDSWALLETPPPNPDNLHYNRIVAAADGALLIAGEAGRVYRSRDEGRRWELLPTGYKGQLYGVLDVDGGLLAYGFGGHVFRHDGKTWHRVESRSRKAYVAGARLADGTVVLASQDGGLGVSHDGGRSLRHVPGPVPLPLADIVATPNGQKVIVAGFGGARLLPVAKTGVA